MKIFIFLAGIGWDWGILGSNNLMNWWDINPPFMYCVFHHISDHLQRLILFWQFYKKVGLRSDPPPWLVQKTKFVKGFIFGAPLTLYVKVKVKTSMTVGKKRIKVEILLWKWKPGRWGIEGKSKNFHVWKWKWKPPYAIPLLAGGEEGGSEVQGQELAARQLGPVCKYTNTQIHKYTNTNTNTS